MTDIRAAQRRLTAAGYDIGPQDGIAGTKTYAGILAFVAQRPVGMLLPFGQAMAAFAPRYGITDTAERLANFVGQAAHESGMFRYMREIWGPTPAQARYEGRADLGNVKAGDGFLYRGRGIFQITGRANYAEIGAAIGKDLIGNPELASSPDVAVLTACYFWASRRLNDLADAGQDDKITKRINGGTNGIAERRTLVGRAKGLLA